MKVGGSESCLIEVFVTGFFSVVVYFVSGLIMLWIL